MEHLKLFDWTHIHRLTGKKLRIKKVYGSVASCYTEDPIHYSRLWGKVLYTDTVVCRMDNLIPIEK
jgi:uncharacterized membrane protein